jgi:hypothetical protein
VANARLSALVPPLARADAALSSFEDPSRLGADFLGRPDGFDHGAGHPLLFLDDAKAPNCRKHNGFKGLGNYSEWPKVAGAVIKAKEGMLGTPIS